jgi:sulfite reductase alpha subunit-like flavoprotein
MNAGNSLYSLCCHFFSRPFDAKNPFLATIKVNRELHKSGERSCMHIEFDIEGSKIRYDTGNANSSVLLTIENTAELY